MAALELNSAGVDTELAFGIDGVSDYRDAGLPGVMESQCIDPLRLDIPQRVVAPETTARVTSNSPI